MNSLSEFNGFRKGIFAFLSDLESEENNNVSWFSENRKRYDNDVVLPAKAFVNSIGEFFNQLNPAIRTEPKFNKTLMRMNKDMRFTKGVPYRTYFLIHFGRFKLDSEFYVYFDKDGLEIGIFLNNKAGDQLFFKENLIKYSKEIKEVFEHYNIAGFDLHKMDKEPELVVKNFLAEKHFRLLENLKYILFQRSYNKTENIIYSGDFLNEAIKTFSGFYPLLCFAYSPRPLTLLNDFEERMGVAF